jgi:hypothetical protein
MTMPATPAPMTELFEVMSEAFDVLEASSDEELALDLFFEEVEFEGEDAKICLTVNDLVSTYYENNEFIVVLTTTDDEEPHPWFRRETIEDAAEQIVRLLVDSEFLTEADAAIMMIALRPDDEME